MKYIVYAINYPTLCRALRYIDSQWGKENSILIYASPIAPLPNAIVREYSAIEIPYNTCQIKGLSHFILQHSLCRNSWLALDRILTQTNDEYTLVVFRDNEPRDATLIEKAFRKYPSRLHLWIMEEGIGLYRNDREPIKAVVLKKCIYPLLGISLYSLKNVPQGVHPYIERVICQHPHLVENKFSSVAIQQQINIYESSFNNRFANYVLEESKTQKCSCDYVFLTTPLDDFINDRHALYGRYNAFLDQLTKTITKHGTLLIKSHPRDNYDYSKLASSRVKICGKQENMIPFECLYEYYGSPQIISFGSSVSLALNTPSPTLLVNEILGFHVSLNDYMESNKCVVCTSWNELDSALQLN